MAIFALILSSLMSFASAVVALFLLNFDASTAFWLYMTGGIAGGAFLIATSPTEHGLDEA